MRVVLDTNILLSALMVRGSPPARLKDSEIGRMVNDLRRLAVMRNDLPRVSRSSDPADDYLLALIVSARTWRTSFVDSCAGGAPS